jgi:ribosomal protein L18E
MPMGPFRTQTQGVNVRDLARKFEAGAEVTPETLLASGLVRHLRHPIKILGQGDLEVALKVTVHGFSASAKQKIEAAGGTARTLGEPSEPVEEAAPARKPKRSAKKDAQEAPAVEAEAAEEAPSAEAEAADETVSEAPPAESDQAEQE